MPALPPTRSPRCMRCAMMRRKPLAGSIEPGATTIQRSHTSSTTPSSCAIRTIRASVRSARKWACRRLQRLESGPESVETFKLKGKQVTHRALFSRSLFANSRQGGASRAGLGLKVQPRCHRRCNERLLSGNPSRIRVRLLLAGFSHSVSTTTSDPEPSFELLVSCHSRPTKRTVARMRPTPEPRSTAFEIRFSDWPALRRESVLVPVLRQVPGLHQAFTTLRFEPRVIARPPNWWIHVRGRYFVVGFQYH